MDGRRRRSGGDNRLCGGVVTAGSGGIAFCPARGANRSGESGGGFNFRQWGKVAYHGHNKRRGLERVDSACEGKAFAEEGQAVTYNVLAVPAGGEFFYVLPDSTRVWINSDSELRFPTNFVDGVRRVELRGEAFFDVAHDRRSPFVVTLSGGDITVYGTRFNVTDYKETGLSAVLVEGSIGFRSLHGDTVRLIPSERMVYGGDETGISVEKVDTELYTAWIDHRFVFRGQTLEEIMSTLARWYDFDIVFADEEARTIRLSGRLNRYDDIRVLLRTYEEVAGVHFNIRGREIVISRK